MGKGKWTEDYFSKQLKFERDARKWSQDDLAQLLSAKGIPMHWTTIAKIEKGTRSVRIDEAAGIADVFDVPLDALLGRSSNRRDEFAYALRATLHVARQLAQQTATMTSEIDETLVDLDALEFDGREGLEADVLQAQRALVEAQAALSRAAQFELPGRPLPDVTLRKDLAVQEIRTLFVAPEQR